jgi:hypothetical protein
MSLRLSDSLPASALIRQRANPWQVAHGLLYLAERLEPRAVEALEPLHSWIHLHDLRLAKPRTWERLILADVEDLEGRL